MIPYSKRIHNSASEELIRQSSDILECSSPITSSTPDIESLVNLDESNGVSLGAIHNIIGLKWNKTLNVS